MLGNTDDFNLQNNWDVDEVLRTYEVYQPVGDTVQRVVGFLDQSFDMSSDEMQVYSDFPYQKMDSKNSARELLLILEVLVIRVPETRQDTGAGSQCLQVQLRLLGCCFRI